jgi:hypothetical protein
MMKKAMKGLEKACELWYSCCINSFVTNGDGVRRVKAREALTKPQIGANGS